MGQSTSSSVRPTTSSSSSSSSSRSTTEPCSNKAMTMTMLSANATTAAVQPTLSSSLLGFVGLWLGGFTSHSGQRLPNSWEQLLEWANTISIWRLFRGDASVDHVDRETVYHTLLSSAIYDEKISSPLREQFNLVFLPTVNVDHVDEVDRLPLLSWIDRAIFFHKHVRIEARSRDHPDTVHCCLTVADLSRLFLLGRHVMELRDVLLQSSSLCATTSTTKTDLPQCQICCNRHETARLTCGHQLCEECEKRWLGRKQSCPFCRKRFGRTWARNGWNLTEFDTMSLRRDLKNVERDLFIVWNEIVLKGSAPQSDDTIEKGRTMVTLLEFLPDSCNPEQ